MFLADNGYEEVAAAVGQSGGVEYFFKVARALDSRGRIGDTFFDCLRAKRSEKAEMIHVLQELWLVRKKQSPKSSRTTTSSGPRTNAHPNSPARQDHSPAARVITDNLRSRRVRSFLEQSNNRFRPKTSSCLTVE